ncbi:MAG: YARHG domain-containing protein [Myxococcales bacterium]|nr:YARHG domain-containing protein [Myxococcales bacterium]
MKLRRALPVVVLGLGLGLGVGCQKPKPADGQAEADKPAVADASDAAKPAGDAKPEGDAKPASDAKPAGDATPEGDAKPDDGAAPPAEARPMYYERALTDADLEGRTLRELDLMRNTIYARIGQQFRKQWLSDYFKAQPWYEPKDAVDEKSLSELDLKNAEKIVDFGNAISAATLREKRDALNEKMRDGTVSDEDKIEFQIIAARLGEWEGGDAIEERRSPLEDPDRLEELLAVDDLDDLSLRDLRILRNTIYARRGRPFRSELLQIFFDDKSWYKPVDEYSDKLLTSVDRKNIRLVMSVEKELGGPISDWGHMMEEGWLYGA